MPTPSSATMNPSPPRHTPAQISDNARTVLSRRYLIRDEKGVPQETPEDLFWRVARVIASEEQRYGAFPEEMEALAHKFYDMMTQRLFEPNSPTLMNAGRPLAQLSACFVLPVTDSLSNGDSGIYDSLRSMALIHQSGGGTGFSFSRIRPKGDVVRSTTGVASGPISFMKLYDASTEVVKQGGSRRGANMGILRIDHPDILEFIHCKQDLTQATNFNLSVAITDAFMQAVEKDQEYDLINPRTGEISGRLRARSVWDQIVENAWRTGEPGVYFIDRANFYNPVPHLGSYEATNPCVTGDTLILTREGPRTFASLAAAGTDVEVYAVNRATGKHTLRWMRRPHRTRRGVPVLRIRFKTGFEVRCTPDHSWITPEGTKVPASDLRPGMRLQTLFLQNGAPLAPALAAADSSHAPTIVLMDPWSTASGTDTPIHVISDDLTHFGVVDTVEPAGLADVYNGLVEEDHTYITVAAVAPDPFAEPCEPLYAGVVSANCGEQPLLPYDVCNLGSVNVGAFVLDVPRPFHPSYEPSVRALLSALRADSQHDTRDHFTRTADSLLVAYALHRGTTDPYATWPDILAAAAAFVESTDPGLELDALMQSTQPTVRRTTTQFLDSTGREQKGILAAAKTLLADALTPGRLDTIMAARSRSPRAWQDSVDWAEYRRVVHLATRFMDNVIDANQYPLPQITETAQRIRRIGLGVMGFADLLVRLNVPYDSEPGIEIGRQIMAFLDEEGKRASENLAQERGTFPEWPHSIWGPDETCARAPNGDRIRPERRLRNCNVSTIAPTGTISIIAGCSSGIEPLFAVAFMRNQAGAMMPDVNEDFTLAARSQGWYSDDLMKRIAKEGHIHFPEVPEHVQRTFVTAHDITPEWHVRMQAAFQENTDAAISKTTNFPHEATVEDVRQIYELAYKMNCKGVTVYRDGSRDNAPLTTGKSSATNSQPGGNNASEALAHAEKALAETREELRVMSSLVFEHRNAVRTREKRKRPQVLQGSTRKMTSPLGDVFVTINEDEQNTPFEVFATLGKAGSVVMADVEAIGRLISLALRFGVPVQEVHTQLRGISSDRAVGFGASKVLSVPDAIAQAIQLREREKEGVQQELLPTGASTPGSNLPYSAPAPEGSSPQDQEVPEYTQESLKYTPHPDLPGLCPECRVPLQFAEGCQKCPQECGFSECS